MWKRGLLVGIGATLASILIVIAIVWPITTFLSYGLPPCESDSLLQLTSRIVLPLAFLVAARFLIQACRRNSWRDFAMGLIIATSFIFLTVLVYKFNDTKQGQCAKRNWNEASKYCDANVKYYRRSIDEYGYEVYTLHAPGAIDSSWYCLQDWKMRHDSVSLEIDESVYEAARAIHSTK